jgi:ABC-type phosphate/phosphonate transport system substrate-binding protein
MADLSKRGNAKTNKYTDVGSAGRAGALNALSAGTADVAVLRSTEADAAAEKSEGKLRSLGAGISAPSSGMWIRKDLVGSEFAKRLEASLLSVNPESTDAAAKRAADGFASGFGVRGQFVEAPAETVQLINDLMSSAQKGFPESFPDIAINEQEKAANLGRPVFEQIR